MDVGTNSVRLLVAERGEPLTQVAREMRITRLGAGVHATGTLDDAALARTLDCIGDYAQRWADLDATRVRVTATSAVRDAADRDRFFDGVEERTGVRPEVLTGEEEARTAFAGATRSVAVTATPVLVLDIGGGSTELIVGEREPAGMVSLQLGCVRLTESRLGGDPPTAEQLAAARQTVDEHLADADRLDAGRARCLVGVAGTVTTLAALHLELPAYQPERIHGCRMPVARVRELTDRLAAMRAGEIAGLGAMAPGREDVIVAGALILERVMSRYGFGEVLVSEADILDGLALALLEA